MELLKYILGHFWTMAIVEVICLLLILIFPFIHWINERKNEKTLGDFYKYLNTDAEGWLLLLTFTLIPYWNMGIVVFTYVILAFIHIRWWLINRSIYKKLTNKLSKIRIR